ncbi:Peptidase S8 [Drechmeria coniospora]|uniref:Peptidase S8 n=1 Tax=Drechmeria coniospora TaxID=98403 RepID=A0A151GM70_DRECN|nr:Peptidase S8 [Drechmeria coniospora]KYK58121.1 Peptidase S8 [Drechmeria coniospora]ODA83040.1 hypothetical protein RJ55_01549 [Drechmeria coniospora]
MVGVKTVAALLLAALPFGTSSPVPVAAPGGSNKYIVKLKDGIRSRELATHLEWVNDVHARSIGRRHLDLSGLDKKFEIGNFNAYSGAFDDATIEEIRNKPEVSYVEPDQVWTLFETAMQNKKTQFNSTYGLATLSHRKPGSRNYVYDSSAGEGGYVYVIDSGVNIDHVEFQGRATRGYNAAGGEFIDGIGHGTHVSGVVAGKRFGVAKKANIIDVKVFMDHSSQTSTILDGFQWAVADIAAKGRRGRAVINMSLGGIISEAFDEAVENAFQSGILSIVAAGNEYQDASNLSPARAPNALTVGAVDEDWLAWRGFGSQGSNYGPAVDIHAPGKDILSSWIGSTTATRSDTGTSMAAPHVAGLAIYLAILEGITDPAALTSRIKELGTRDSTENLPKNTVNLLANNGSED